jgi:hypothetical protein
LTPDELSATSVVAVVVAVDCATGRFARRCKAIASGDTGGLATAACPKAAEGTRLHITVALAMTNSLVEEKMRDRTAVMFRSFPEGEDPRRVEIIVGLLLKGLHNEVLSVYLYTSLCSCETAHLVISY